MIRKATLADLDQLVELERTGFDSDFFTRAQFRHYLTHGRGVVLLDNARGKARGMAVVMWRNGSKSCRLYSIVVRPGQRGRGLGGRLLDAAEAHARRQDFARLVLEVRRDNATAIRFYEARGYRRFDVIPDYYQDGTDALRYVKDLA